VHGRDCSAHGGRFAALAIKNDGPGEGGEALKAFPEHSVALTAGSRPLPLAGAVLQWRSGGKTREAMNSSLAVRFSPRLRPRAIA
jgi:hypothetical protein